MRYFYTLTLSFFISTSLMAQIPGGGAPAITGRISGVVIDSITQKPIDYVTVSLSRATSTRTTNGTLTDAKGSFKIDNIAPGKYKVSLSFMGYTTKVISPVETTPGKPDFNLGRVVLSPSATALKEVSVTGQASIIENRVDKVVYNAEKDATVGGGNASDVLRKVPMVSVDQDGNVSLRGSQNVRVLINGKPTGAVAGSIADAMRMLPADQIKNVEVITSPSAKYDAEGSAGIINIITKKREMSGVSGSISGGLGTRQNNGNANLNVNKNRLSITGNLGGNFGWPQESRLNFSRLTADTLQVQNGTTETQRHAVVGSGNLSYDFNSSNSISSGIRFNQGGFSTDGTSLNRLLKSNSLLNAYNTHTDNENQFGGFDWNADFVHKFKKPGHEFTIAGQWSHMKTTTDFTTNYDNDILDQIGNNEGINDEYTAQLDYSLPITGKFKVELGGKLIARDISSDIVYNLPGLSNDYSYSQDVYSAYTVFTLQLPKAYGLQFGGRVENTEIEGRPDSDDANFEPFTNSYPNFVPNVSLSKTIKNNTFRLSYSKRIQRPSLQFLNPFRNISNPLNHSIGNPDLEPEITQSVEFNFSTFIKSSVINASVYYRNTSNVIESYVVPDIFRGDTVSLSTYRNVGKNNSLGASFFGQINPVQKLTLRGNINAFTYNPSVNSSVQGSAAASSDVFLMYNAFINGSYSFPKGFTAETYLIVNSPRRTFQGKNPSFNMWVLAFNKEILNKKGRIGLNIMDPFNDRKNFKSEINGGRFVQNSNFSIPFRSVGVNFSWQFGKMNFNPQQQQRRRRGVNNDDLKQDGGQGGQGVQGQGQGGGI